MIGIDRRMFSNIDWFMVGLAVFISVAGIMTIFSATRPLPGGEQPDYYIKQIYWFLLGILALVSAVSFDYVWLRSGAFKLYGISVALLFLVIFMGRIGMGAQRWIQFGPFGFQPSEFFKLVFLVVIARHLGSIKRRLILKDVVFAFMAFLFVPLVLILKQPDLGTALMLLAIFTLMVLTKGVGKKAVAVTLIIAAISVPFMGGIFWDRLKDYQKKRILSFVQPDIDPEGISYHVMQSKVAVGSGGLFGKGYMRGTQGPFRFLPEKHTDFVFSIFAEEWGFMGSIVLLMLYLFIIFRGLSTAEDAKDEFGRLLALGICFMFLMYCFVNIGMTLGLMPVVGIPLPFMSYGGTATITNFFALGLLINIRMRRFELFY